MKLSNPKRNTQRLQGILLLAALLVAAIFTYPSKGEAGCIRKCVREGSACGGDEPCNYCERWICTNPDCSFEVDYRNCEANRSECCPACRALEDLSIDELSFREGVCKFHVAGEGVGDWHEVEDNQTLGPLFTSMMFRLEKNDTPRQKSLACAVLEQTRVLCQDGIYQLPVNGGCNESAEANCERTQTRSCHPNAGYDCREGTRHVLDLRTILGNATGIGNPSFTKVPAEETYCTGQVIDDVGYAMEIPEEPVPWECDAVEEAAFQGIVEDPSGNPLLGMKYWGTSTNQCRYVKALLNCVLPNLGESETCVVDREDGGVDHVDNCTASNWPIYCGVRHPEFGPYCFRVVLAEGGVGGSAHDMGLAADFNNGIYENDDGSIHIHLGQWNSGTLGQVNLHRPPQMNIPPEFVAIMEGCGFKWGGRMFDAAIARTPDIEGCDPMHFELPCIDGLPCHKDCEDCILSQQPEILSFYEVQGWDTSSANYDEIVTDWCINVDPSTCNAVKMSTCQAVCTPIVNVDVTVVIDSSGSMGSNDPNGHRKTAARIYVDPVSAPGDYVGVVDFDSRAKILSELLRIPEGEDTLKQQIGKIDASGSTDIGAGVLAACGVLSRSESDNEKKAAILLTDGVGTWRGYENQCFVQNPDWYLYAFGFGGANMAQLNNIVNGTGGSAQWLPAPHSFLCEFQRLRSRLAGLDPADCVQSHCNPGQTIEFPANVPPSQAQATFSISWPGSDIVMTLITPSGRVIDRATEAPDVTHERGGTFEVYGVVLPEPGEWRVSLYGAEVRPGGEPVTFGMTTVPIGNANSPPDVSKAVPSVSELWPVNHKMKPVHIFDVTDPDGDPVTLEITAITQDEPVKRPDKTAPDGEGVGLDFAFLRAERWGRGNGRVYEITFVARDDKGAEATGSVTVCVPHDRGSGQTCVDDGQQFDSTVE